MSNKKIFKYEEIKDKIKKAVDTIADPVRQTLSPKGSNVIYEDSSGDQHSTNDGVTIAKNINVKDPVENAVIEIIKQPALQTNSSVGDGTTTTILLSQVMIKESMKLIDEGMNRMVLKENLELMTDKIKSRLMKNKMKVKGASDIVKIAKISANNDDVIAKDVARVVEVAGQEGMVFIEPNSKAKTELVEEMGFGISTELYQDFADGKYIVSYSDVPVLITDKRLYYKEEAETILRTALKAGWDTIVVVARDFIGQAPNFFIANHKEGRIRVLLVKDPQSSETDNSSLEDLATYVGGNLVTDKRGKIVDTLQPSDFVFVKKVVANPVKTLFMTSKPNNAKLKERVKSIKEELLKDENDKKLKNRLASLTNGTVTIKVGGRTPIEVQERMFRYEDSVNAARAAMKDGYLVGGGLALLDSYDSKDHDVMNNVAYKVCSASVRQIAENCGKHIESVIEKCDASKGIGYNAKTDKFTNLLADGVIDPFRVTEMALDNATSITIHLLTSGYFIINDLEDLKDTK